LGPAFEPDTGVESDLAAAGVPGTGHLLERGPTGELRGRDEVLSDGRCADPRLVALGVGAGDWRPHHHLQDGAAVDRHGCAAASAVTTGTYLAV
jgi:hypothetical protein